MEDLWKTIGKTHLNGGILYHSMTNGIGQREYSQLGNSEWCQHHPQ